MGFDLWLLHGLMADDLEGRKPYFKYSAFTKLLHTDFAHVKFPKLTR